MPYLRANTDAPFGAMPYDGTLRIRPYNKVVGYATRIFPGDFVTLVAAGNVQVAAAGDRLLGVAAENSAASTAKGDFLVYDHPNQLFVVQNDDGGTALAQTNVGNNADILATAGDTTTGRSLHELDQSDAQTTTAQLKIVGAHECEDSTPGTRVFGANRKVIVRISEHIYGSGSESGV